MDTTTPTTTLTRNALITARIKSDINAAIYRVVNRSHPSESPTQTQIAHALAIVAGEWASMASKTQPPQTTNPKDK
jgi:hypothetical protein